MTKKAIDKPIPKRKPNAPVVFSKEMNEWLKNGGTNPKVNNFKVGGGH